MLHDERRTVSWRRLIYLAVLTSLAVAALAVSAAAQETTPDQTTPDETTPDEDSQQPQIPPGFTEEECETTETDGGTQIVCRHEESSQSETFRESASGELVETREAVGATRAGAGGTASDGPGALLPILIGAAGLAMALAAGLALRRARAG
jgi:cytoskeletal protein RodZ